MSWDSSRPVPWRRLAKEWVIYAAIMSAIFLLLFRGSNTIGAIGGVLVSGPLYLAFGYVLAKFGYQRKTMAELRAARESGAGGRSTSTSADDPAGTTRPKRPPPTRRTSTGPNRPAKRKRR